ncbi:hypothetical protein IPG36_01475 [bacterium]|nr:MAG: hypothetical protein IPG36_01475 [bacterium]
MHWWPTFFHGFRLEQGNQRVECKIIAQLPVIGAIYEDSLALKSRSQTSTKMTKKSTLLHQTHSHPELKSKMAQRRRPGKIGLCLPCTRPIEPEIIPVTPRDESIESGPDLQTVLSMTDLEQSARVMKPDQPTT